MPKSARNATNPVLVAADDLLSGFKIGAPADFASLLFKRAAREDVDTLSARGLAEAAAAAFTHLKSPRTREHESVGLIDIAAEIGGKQRQITIVQIVNDNMSFLLDSTLSELQDQGLEPRLVAHPILAVERDANGTFIALKGEAEARAPEGARRESLIHIHLDRLDTPQARQRLLDGLAKVYADVRVAVADWSSMRARVSETILAYKANPPPLAEDEVTEAVQFLEWIAAENFTLLGVRAYRFPAGDAAADPVEGSGLGILRDPSVRVLRRGTELVAITPEIRAFLSRPQALIITKANVKARVHRRVHLDYIGVKLFTADGRLDGELRIVGLFTSNAYTDTVAAIPYLRLKARQIAKRAGFDSASYSGRALMNVLDGYPRDELFQIDLPTLERNALAILQLTERPRVRALPRVDEFDRFVSVIVFIPKDRYDTGVRRRVGDFLTRLYQGRLSAAYPSYPEGPLARTHFIIGRDAGKTPNVSQTELESGVAAIARTWADNLKDALDEAKSGPQARALTDRYAEGFGAAYRENFSATEALGDITTLQTLTGDRLRAVDFYRRDADPETRANLKVFARGEPAALSARVPLLENMGFTVVNERTYRIVPQGADEASRVWLHDMTLTRADGGSIDIARVNPLLEAALMAQFRGLAESDRFDGLTLAAGFGWREAALMRAFGRYLRQIGAPYAQDYIASALIKHHTIAAALLKLFLDRFDPRHSPEARAAGVAAAKAAIEAGLASVTSLDEDLILRRYVNLIESAQRSNFFQLGKDGFARPTIAFKLKSALVDGMPRPSPLYEIFVYSPRVEGVHLRFGEVARGGLRWSDRPQDFRTEVLGLVKAQQVKNAVIVPVGAKGGFVPKQLPPASDRAAWMAEGTESYRIFVRTLLELTDNLDGETVVPPADTVRHDGDDPYLVVAADKGTATFSDTANALSAEKGHWLGDAFASGGSQGYDHKKMGITARGAWEAVKRHFREIDHDIQNVPFTVAGVGDMSGDVFGNGMLLSKQIKLVAAFDHRDIFLDPTPDIAASFAERARMFNLPRSSWQDYDKSLISKGGGIFPRSAKSVQLSPEIRALVGLDKAEVTPQALMNAILRMQVDLLWFGGIGTYIRAADETDAQVGDRANDAIRMTGSEIRAKVIGEGANLGATQKGRIEAARAGVRLNTDAIDNSAGVNTSDVEVNIKIALAKPEHDGRLTQEARNALLAEMTDEVGLLVLRNNYLQSLALTLSETRGTSEIPAMRRLMRKLEADGRLDRGIEYLPSNSILAERERKGEKITRPEMAVLLAYAKLALHDALLASGVPDDPYLARELVRYFPKALQERFPDTIASHKLKREIVATQLANAIINRGGPAIVTELSDRTGADAPVIAAAYAIARDSYGLIALNGEIDALDSKISGTAQTALYAAAQDLVIGRMAWFLRRGEARIGAIESVVTRYQGGIKAVIDGLDDALSTEAAQARAERKQALIAENVPESLATRIADLPALAQAPEIVWLSERLKAPVARVAKALFAVDAAFGLSRLADQARAVPAADDYERLARDRAVETLGEALQGLTAEVVSSGGDLGAWTSSRETDISRARAMVDGIVASGLSLPKLMVAAGTLADLPRVRRAQD